MIEKMETEENETPGMKILIILREILSRNRYRLVLMINKYLMNINIIKFYMFIVY